MKSKSMSMWMMNGAHAPKPMPVTSGQRSRWYPAALASGVVAVLLSAGCAQLQNQTPQPVTPGTVSVTTADPDGFTHSPGMVRESRAARKAWVTQLSEHVADRLAEALPVGDTAEVRITDVRRAGSLEPTRGGDVRVVTDMYPPRIALTFEIRSADEKLMQSGVRTLQDSSFQLRGRAHDGDPLRYEKALIDDWVSKEFKGKR